MKPLDAANDNVALRTRQVWEPRLGRELGSDEARQITANVTGFFELLAKWAQAEPPLPANDPGEPIRRDDNGVADGR
jgi:hypothetical protein